MKIELLNAPIRHQIPEKTYLYNMEFFERIVAFIKECPDVLKEFMVDDMRVLFAVKFEHYLLFDYFLTTDGILIKFNEQDCLLGICDTTEILND